MTASVLVALLAPVSLCLAPLSVLRWWARATDARALASAEETGVEPTPTPAPLPRARLAAAIALQAGGAVLAWGPAAGLAAWAGAWMVVGWCFTLALNAHPARVMRMAHRLGVVGASGLVVTILLIAADRLGC